MRKPETITAPDLPTRTGKGSDNKAFTQISNVFICFCLFVNVFCLTVLIVNAL